MTKSELLLVFALIMTLVILRFPFLLPDPIERFFAEKVSVKFVYVDHDCKPIANSEIQINNLIVRGDWLITPSLSDSDTYITDSDGVINATLYMGLNASATQHGGYTLKKFNRAELKWIKANKSDESVIALYSPYMQGKTKKQIFRGWIIDPKFRQNEYNPDGAQMAWINLSRGDISTGHISRGYNPPNSGSLIISAEPVEGGYSLIIESQKDTGIILVGDDTADNIYGELPTTGYRKTVKIFLPSTIIPYEKRDDWVHKKLYVKVNNGRAYGFVNLDLGFISSYDSKHHDYFYKYGEVGNRPRGGKYSLIAPQLELLAIWSQIEIHRSDVSYAEYSKASTIITKPFIEEEKCHSLLNESGSGYDGRHPLPSKRYLRQRNKKIRWVNSEIEKETSKNTQSGAKKLR